MTLGVTTKLAVVHPEVQGVHILWIWSEKDKPGVDKVTVEPGHMVKEGLPEMVVVGNGKTTTVNVLMVEQPDALVLVTVYIVVTLGDTTMVGLVIVPGSHT